MTQFSKDGTPPLTKIVRLRNGETLIATMQGFGKEVDYVLLEKPMSVVSMPVLNKAGKVERVGVYLKDWIEYTNDTYFTVSKDMILTIAEPDEKMMADYIEAKIHSDLQKAQDELKEVMKEYISKMEFPNMPMSNDDDKQVESGYTSEANESDEEEDEGDEDDEDDGLPWWNGNPRVRF